MQQYTKMPVAHHIKFSASCIRYKMLRAYDDVKIREWVEVENFHLSPKKQYRFIVIPSTG